MLKARSIRTKEFRTTDSVQPIKCSSAARTCSVLLSLVCLSALFLGLFFPQSALCDAVAGREVILGNTLFGLLMERLQGSLPAPPMRLMPVLLYEIPLVVAAAIVLSLITTVLSLLTRAAPELLYWNCLFVVLGYAYASFVVFADGKSLSSSFAPDALIPLALAVLIYAIYLLTRRRNIGGIFLFLLSLCALFSVVVPQTPLKKALFDAFARPLPIEHTLCLFLFTGVTALNALLSLFRIGAKKGYLFEVIRYSLQCALLAAYVTMTAIEMKSFEFVNEEPYAFLVLALLPVIAFILSVSLRCAERTKRK